MRRPEGFEYEGRDGEVVVRHHGRRATRVTGSYRRGNERTAKAHPCNAGRR